MNVLRRKQLIEQGTVREVGQQLQAVDGTLGIERELLVLQIGGKRSKLLDRKSVV